MMLITRKKLKHEKQHKTNDRTFDGIAYDFFATVKKTIVGLLLNASSTLK